MLTSLIFLLWIQFRSRVLEEDKEVSFLEDFSNTLFETATVDGLKLVANLVNDT